MMMIDLMFFKIEMEKDYNYLEAGEFQPYFPSNDLIDVFYKKRRTNRST